MPSDLHQFIPDVQHVEKRSFGSTNFISSLDEFQVSGNFNGTTSNLGRDAKSLEERRLAGFHASVSSRDVHIVGGDGAGSGRSSNSVAQNFIAGLLEVTIGLEYAVRPAKLPRDALYVRRRSRHCL